MSRGYDDTIRSVRKIGFLLTLIAIPVMAGLFYFVYTFFRIDVPAKHIAVLLKRTGKDLDNHQILAPDIHHKGLQEKVLTEGRYFYNPYNWDWHIYPMIEVPENKMGIRVRMYGESLPYGDFVATDDKHKGIVREVLRPGRYPLNAVVKEGDKLTSTRTDNNYAEIVELHDPVTIPAGFKGIVTNLSGPIPEDSNELLSKKGQRGAQQETLDPSTYYMNPYENKIIAFDCRSQRFNLAENEDMGFPSKDGFWVSLDGIVEFRVKPEKASEIYVLYNDDAGNSHINKEIIRKIIMPNARSFCRMKGSNNSGRDFIGGETRSQFQASFQTSMREACEEHGIEIVQALITRINPPQAIAGPVRDREVAHQKLKQYQEQKLQQEQEALLATEKALIEQKQELVGADQLSIQTVTTAKENQKVLVTKAEEDLEVSRRDLEAAKDKAIAILAGKKAEAGVIEFENEADSAGWKQAVESMGSGDEYARFILYQKLAPAFKNIVTNTANSPLMDVFKNFQKPQPQPSK